MPWAITDRVGTDYIEGGVEITFEEYQHAVEMMMAGYMIVVENGVVSFVFVQGLQSPENE
jgi:hypothetical protein